MKIATSSEYINEKLNIQPITKDRLKKTSLVRIQEGFGWKNKLKTGDVVVCKRENKGEIIYREYYYISMSDFNTIYVNDPFMRSGSTDLGSKLYDEFGGAFLLNYNRPHLKATPPFIIATYLSLFYDDKMEDKKWGFDLKIVAIYRMNNLQYPPKPSFFEYMPDLKQKGWIQIYKRDDSELNEKLNIQPVSKEILNNRILEINGWKSKLKTGDFISITTKTKDIIGNILKKVDTYIFVSLNDYQDYYKGDILDIGKSAEKECGSGILVTSDEYNNLSYIPLARFEDDRMYLIPQSHNIGKERMITRILRIPNLKQPLDRNFFINKTVDVLKCVQIYNRT